MTNILLAESFTLQGRWWESGGATWLCAERGQFKLTIGSKANLTNRAFFV